MQQMKLFGPSYVQSKNIDFENVKASFLSLENGGNELLLEINSNKFLIHFKTLMNRIEQLEIIAIKGFVELSVSVLRTIKKIVSKLYFEF